MEDRMDEEVVEEIENVNPGKTIINQLDITQIEEHYQIDYQKLYDFNFLNERFEQKLKEEIESIKQKLNQKYIEKYLDYNENYFKKKEIENLKKEIEDLNKNQESRNQKLLKTIEELKDENEKLKRNEDEKIKRNVENDSSSNIKTGRLHDLYKIICESTLYEIIDQLKNIKKEEELYQFLVSYFILNGKQKLISIIGEDNFSKFENSWSKEKSESYPEKVYKIISKEFVKGLSKRFDLYNLDFELNEDHIKQILDLILMISTFKPKITWINPDINKKIIYDTNSHKSEDDIKVSKIITPGIKVNGFIVYRAKVEIYQGLKK